MRWQRTVWLPLRFIATALPSLWQRGMVQRAVCVPHSG